MSLSAPYAIPKPTLFWLLSALLLVVLPHVPRLPMLVIALFLTLLSWRYMISVYGWRQVSRPLRFALIGLGVAVVYINFGTLVGRDAGIALLVTMLGIKLLEMFTHRDVYITILIAYFLVITHFLYSQSIFTAVFMFAVVVVITAALVDLNRHRHTGVSVITANLRISASLLIQATPFMLLMFFLFPRIGAPLWGLPDDAAGGITGLSDQMEPGAISRLSQSDAVAFRVEFPDGPPAVSDRYWRGPVLWHTNGRNWRGRSDPQQTLSVRNKNVEFFGDPVSYSVMLEPHNRRWLFALDLPTKIPPDATITADHQLINNKMITQRTRYEMVSYPNYRMHELDTDTRFLALQLPAKGHPRTRELGERWQRETAGNAAQIVDNALKMFRNQPFVYTLTPPLLLSVSPLDEFLFETRRGFCEHYSASFVMLMRAAGVPARVVTGYQGGELNPVGNYMIVRQRDAHAWAEVWLEGFGWVRVDPTAAVAPERVEQAIDNTVGAEGEAIRFTLPESSLLRSLVNSVRFGWDSLNHNWNKWVLNYDENRQRDFLRSLGIGIEGWREMVAYLAGGMLGLLSLLGLFLLYRSRQPVEPIVKLWRKYCRKLARKGIARRTNEGPLDYTRRSARIRPDLSEQIEKIGHLYITLRYSKRSSPAQFQQLRREIRAFKP